MRTVHRRMEVVVVVVGSSVEEEERCLGRVEVAVVGTAC